MIEKKLAIIQYKTEVKVNVSNLLYIVCNFIEWQALHYNTHQETKCNIHHLKAKHIIV